MTATVYGWDAELVTTRVGRPRCSPGNHWVIKTRSAYTAPSHSSRWAGSAPSTSLAGELYSSSAQNLGTNPCLGTDANTARQAGSVMAPRRAS
ncbi:MAG TPA: hypothetical protein VGH89_31800 [Pseudonocardia sp.]|jgi:hypothetical protein